MRSLVAFTLGVATGWTLRSIADSPEGLGVKILEIACSARDRVGLWVAEERERLEDMLAEARSKVTPKRRSSNAPAAREAAA